MMCAVLLMLRRRASTAAAAGGSKRSICGKCEKEAAAAQAQAVQNKNTVSGTQSEEHGTCYESEGTGLRHATNQLPMQHSYMRQPVNTLCVCVTQCA